MHHLRRLGRVTAVADSAGHPTTTNYNDSTTPGTVTRSHTDAAGTAGNTASVTDLDGRHVSYMRPSRPRLEAGPWESLGNLPSLRPMLAVSTANKIREAVPMARKWTPQGSTLVGLTIALSSLGLIVVLLLAYHAVGGQDVRAQRTVAIPFNCSTAAALPFGYLAQVTPSFAFPQQFVSPTLPAFRGPWPPPGTTLGPVASPLATIDGGTTGYELFSTAAVAGPSSLTAIPGVQRAGIVNNLSLQPQYRSCVYDLSDKPAAAALAKDTTRALQTVHLLASPLPQDTIFSISDDPLDSRDEIVTVQTPSATSAPCNLPPTFRCTGHVAVAAIITAASGNVVAAGMAPW